MDSVIEPDTIPDKRAIQANMDINCVYPPQTQMNTNSVSSRESYPNVTVCQMFYFTVTM